MPTMPTADVSSPQALRALVEPKHPMESLGGGLSAAEWVDRFDAIYREASGDIDRVPWAHRQPCPALVAWLNAEAPLLVRCGGRAAVVGCGLGEDACLLRERGYDVVAFDASPSAIEWARRLHPDDADMFQLADVLDLPSRLQHRFDLVVEVHTLQALPVNFRGELARGMASMLSHRGVLVAIARGREPSVPAETLAGPPFPLTSGEMGLLMEDAGLTLVRPIDDYTDDATGSARRLRGVFRRA